MSTSENDQTGPETWVPAAIAQQEEYLKRRATCGGGGEHSFHEFGVPGRDHAIRREHLYDACIACGVTRSDDDYHRRLAGLAAR